MFDFKIPVELENTPDSWFVGISVATISKLPSGWKHGTYKVWTEAVDADGGSNVVYRRAYQIFHGCLDRAVRECR